MHKRWLYLFVSILFGLLIAFLAPAAAAIQDAAQISLEKTVGTDSGVCAPADSINVPFGTDVTYCYEVTNTGTLTLTVHDLEDSELGPILSGFSYALVPGASAFLTQTINVTQTVVNSATWTAYNPGPADIATDIDVATVNVLPGCTIGSWQPVSPVNTGRSRPGLAYSPASGKFYLAGGEASGGGRDNPIEEYDPIADTWTDKSLLLTGVSNSGAAGIGQYIYVPGGYNGLGGVADMQRFDVLANDVITMTAMPAPNYAHAVVTLDDKIYILGGASTGAAGTTNYIYDVAGDSWDSGAPLPTAVNYPAAATDGTYIYVLGGTTANLATVQRYNPATDSWDSISDMGTGRGGPGAFFDGINMWVVGGGWTSYLTSSEYWNGSVWLDGPAMNTGVRTTGAAFGDGMALKAAGWNGGYESAAEMLEISCAPDISADAALASMQSTGQVVTQTLTISNTGVVDLDWSIEEAADSSCTPASLPWVSVDPSAGSTAPVGTSLVEVTFDSSGLAAGVYTGALCLASNDPDEPQLAVELTLDTTEPDISVDPVALSAAQNPNQVVMHTLTISNSGVLDLNWTIAEAADGSCTSASLPWVSVDPAADTTSSGASLVEVTFDSSGLAVGTYSGALCVASNDPDEPEVAVPLTLNVTIVDLYLPVILKP